MDKAGLMRATVEGSRGHTAPRCESTEQGKLSVIPQLLQNWSVGYNIDHHGTLPMMHQPVKGFHKFCQPARKTSKSFNLLE
ncbi:hypothetical protein P4O66_003186 [Electrophorus voltai]|uniref:Uncharacterized protein n=1 Tax=Electrophorus voltai TaxID=2609070 RepID=A0AAD9DL71_9TELE|nr:hypothetical protein P4O66_003186 [Electrophorus voltai]